MLNKTPCPIVALLGLLLLMSLPVLAAGDEKTSEVKEFQFGEPHVPVPAAQHVSNTGRLPTDKTSKRKIEKQRVSITSVVNTDYWIYDSWLVLGKDNDYDGYASSLSITLDVDTVYADVLVYAVFYLGDSDTFYPVHESSNFYIFGRSTADEFVIDTTLVSGFRPFDYDIMIEIYDAYTHQLVAITDHTTDADLSYVPLESADYDAPPAYHDTVVVTREGGALYWPGLIVLATFALWRRTKRG